jgi:hypothetical protein
MTGKPDAPHRAPAWLQKLKQETAEYLAVFAYMAAILLAFAIYNRAILAEYGVAYLPIAFGLLEAAILAKIVVIGQAFHFGARFDGRPLAWTVLYRSTAFAVLTALFAILEEGVKRLLHHQKLIEHQPGTGRWRTRSSSSWPSSRSSPSRSSARFLGPAR